MSDNGPSNVKTRGLGAVDTPRDPSGPHEHRAYIPDVVYRDLITHAAFRGAPSTGKATIAERLAEVLRTSWTPEFGRDSWTEHQRERRLTPEQLLEIAHGHLAHEERLMLRANRWLFTDTTAMTTATFARRYHGTMVRELADLAARAARRYDLVFPCDTGIPSNTTRRPQEPPLRRTVGHREHDVLERPRELALERGAEVARGAKGIVAEGPAASDGQHQRCDKKSSQRTPSRKCLRSPPFADPSSGMGGGTTGAAAIDRKRASA